MHKHYQSACAPHTGIKAFAAGALLAFAIVGNVSAQLSGPTVAWAEQVQLHDGSKIIAKRSYVLGGRSEPGARESSSTFQAVVFNTPAGDVEWTTDFRDSQPEPNSLSLIAFDIVKGVPYIATRPAGCIAYNKWQRPNPPQVLFKYVSRQWVRIGLEEFPMEITQANVVLGRPSTEVLKPFYSAEDVQKENRDVKYLEYRSILREPMNYDPSCIPMVTNGKGLWLSKGWFSKKPSLEACLAGCRSESFDDNTCPCKQIFEGK
jgi:hypothetical protein